MINYSHYNTIITFIFVKIIFAYLCQTRYSYHLQQYTEPWFYHLCKLSNFIKYKMAFLFCCQSLVMLNWVRVIGGSPVTRVVLVWGLYETLTMQYDWSLLQGQTLVMQNDWSLLQHQTVAIQRHWSLLQVQTLAIQCDWLRLQGQTLVMQFDWLQLHGSNEGQRRCRLQALE